MDEWDVQIGIYAGVEENLIDTLTNGYGELNGHAMAFSEQMEEVWKVALG